MGSNALLKKPARLFPIAFSFGSKPIKAQPKPIEIDIFKIEGSPRSLGRGVQLVEGKAGCVQLFQTRPFFGCQVGRKVGGFRHLPTIGAPTKPRQGHSARNRRGALPAGGRVEQPCLGMGHLGGLRPQLIKAADSRSVQPWMFSAPW